MSRCKDENWCYERVRWWSRAMFKVVLTHGKNGGGPVGEKNSRSDVRGVRLRGRPQMGWMDDVKRVLNERGKSDCA